MMKTTRVILFGFLLVIGCGESNDPGVLSAPDELDYRIEIAVNSDDAEDIGGGSWLLEVSTRIYDQFSNPAGNGILVNFSITPDKATISPAVTGNQNRSTNRSYPGMAFTTLIYNSANTFDTVSICAEAPELGSNVIGNLDYNLPLQNGLMVLYIDPENFMFESEEDTAVIRCRVRVWDDHNERINNAPALFTASRGRFFWFDYETEQFESFAEDKVLMLTGQGLPENPQHRDEDGEATVFLLLTEDDVFLDQVTPEINVQVNAALDGLPDVVADPEILNLTRRYER